MRWWLEAPVRRWMVARPLAMDAALAAALAALSLIVHATITESAEQSFRSPTWWTVVLVVATVAPVAVRRRQPEIAAVAVVTLQSLSELAEINATLWIPNLVVVYSLGAHSEGRRRTVTAGIVAAIVAGILTLGAVYYYDQVPLIVLSMLSAGALMLAAFLVGDVVKRRRLEVVTLATRAERAERERELLAAQQVGAERARIARELHDVVAHSVSVMVIQATAARRHIERAPDDAAALLDSIATTGRATMRELRQILGVLRPDEATDVEYSPLVGDLDTLARSLPGLNVELRSDGSWEQLPPSLALQGYRIIQEALTNAHRYAGPHARVQVDVSISSSRFELRVVDDGRGASAAISDPQSPHGVGYGLIGMRERAAAFGGSLRAAPRRSGGWEVVAAFPIPTGDSPDTGPGARSPDSVTPASTATSTSASTATSIATATSPTAARR